MPDRRQLLYTAIIAGLLTAPTASRAADWPAFRGPNGDSRVVAAGLFSGERTVVLKEAWKREVGAGYSGLAVADGLLFTLFSNGTQDTVGAFDAATGEKTWGYAFGSKTEDNSSDSGPLATPLVAEGRVIALGPSGHLLALSAKGGKLLWQHQLVEEFGATKPTFGFATSPILADGVLVLQIGAGEARTVMGFDPATGETRWSVGHDGVGYQSPLAMEFEGRSLVLAVGDTKLFGIEAASGKLLFEHAYGAGPARDGNNATNPAPAGPGEILLTRSLEDAVLLRIRSEAENLSIEEVWTSRAMGRSYSSVVYHDRHFYAYNGFSLHCVNAATGELVWRSRQPGEGHLLLADGHLVILTVEGGVHVAKADPAGYQEVAALKLFKGQVLTYPSLAGNSLYLRGYGEMARVAIHRPSPAK